MRISVSSRRGLLSLGAIGTCLLLAAQLSGASRSTSAQALTMPGVWAVTITPSHCETKQPLGFPAIRTLLTFHRDQTTTESVAAFAPGQRSGGHGTWTHTGGQAYQERTLAMILFDAGIYKTGWQVITRNITLVDANRYTSFGNSDFYDANGQLYMTLCASSVAERFE